MPDYCTINLTNATYSSMATSLPSNLIIHLQGNETGLAGDNNSHVGDSMFGGEASHHMTSDKHDKEAHIMNQPNTALLSLILILGTFLIAYFLRVFRNSKFLGRGVRPEESGGRERGVCVCKCQEFSFPYTKNWHRATSLEWEQAR